MGIDVPLELFHRGKVRDTYLIPGFPDLLLVVVTDRMSTYNVTHLSEFPGKGYYLTAQTVFFLTMVLKGIPTHLVASGAAILQYLPPAAYPADLVRRAIVVRRCEMVPLELIWRKHLVGSLAKALKHGTDPYGIGLSRDLPIMHEFDPPLFTPTRKSKDDEPMEAASVRESVPDVVELTRQVFETGSAFLKERGIVGIDSKFEVGTCLSGPYAGRLVLADEAWTSDSSRFAFREDLLPGKEPQYPDKETARIYSLKNWGEGPRVPLRFTDEQIRHVMEGYRQLFERLTLSSLEDFQKELLTYQEAA